MDLGWGLWGRGDVLCGRFFLGCLFIFENTIYSFSCWGRRRRFLFDRIVAFLTCSLFHAIAVGWLERVFALPSEGSDTQLLLLIFGGVLGSF
jgi:hypothetical protein